MQQRVARVESLARSLPEEAPAAIVGVTRIDPDARDDAWIRACNPLLTESACQHSDERDRDDQAQVSGSPPSLPASAHCRLPQHHDSTRLMATTNIEPIEVYA